MPNARVTGHVFNGAPPMDAEIVNVIISGQRIVWVAGSMESGNGLLHVTTFRFQYDVSSLGYTGAETGNDAN